MFEKVKEMIAQYVEADLSGISDSTRFADDLGFNSYDFMCMLGDAEDELDLEIDEAAASKLKTVGELVAYLEGLQ